MEKKKCIEDMNDRKEMHGMAGRKSSKMAYEVNNEIVIEINHCLAYRKFANLWETTQTLFWASFGLIDLDNFELNGIKEFTRFWGLIMFGSFSVINIIVLLNLLIAMMNHSYQLISVSSEKADTEWKFARSKLWISYFEEGGTVPPPFNIIPTPKTIYYIIRWIYSTCFKSKKMMKEHIMSAKRKVSQASERDKKYQAIMRNLVRRYVTQEQRKAENEGVTEDDVNEIKNDISAFRFELIEIMRVSGMNTGSATGPSGPGGKKNRQKERRLMKGFLSVSGTASAAGNSVSPGSGKLNNLAVSPVQPIPETTEVKLDITSCKKMPTVGIGLNRITELVISDKNTLSVPSSGGNGSVKLVVSNPGSVESLPRCRKGGMGNTKKNKPGTFLSETGSIKRREGTAEKVTCQDVNEEEVGKVNKTVEKVMIRGGSSSDSGTDMMMVRCAGRQLHRTYRIDQSGETVVRENDSEEFPSNPSSPYSSLLDAPIPTVSSSSLLNFSQSNSEQTLVKQSSPTTRIQQTVKSGWI